MKSVLFFCLFAFLPFSAAAQDDPEYKLELGGGGGMVSYQGDFNGNLLKGFETIASVTAKYRMNPRMSWAAVVSYGELEGSSRAPKTWYPELSESLTPYLFTTNLVDVGLRFEYNFWAYGTGREYRGAKPLAPFVLMGLGMTIADPDVKDAKTAVAGNLALGFGVKYKMTTRLNLTAEWAMHFSGSDELDGVRDPYGIKSSGLFKNTDCYSALQLMVTYDLWAKCKTCHNDRD